ncbi:MAG: hypothetical protein ACYDGW_07880 [Vulcanimicrobiaceae bacterium]
MNRVAVIGAIVVVGLLGLIATSVFGGTKRLQAVAPAHLTVLAENAASALAVAGNATAGRTWTTSDPQLGTVTYRLVQVTPTTLSVSATADSATVTATTTN